MNSDIEEHCGRLLDSAREELFSFLENHLVKIYPSLLKQKHLYILIRGVRRESEIGAIEHAYGGRRYYSTSYSTPTVDITIGPTKDCDILRDYLNLDGVCVLPKTIEYFHQTRDDEIFLDMERMRDLKILMSM